MILLAISLSAVLSAAGPAGSASLAITDNVCAAPREASAGDRFILWHNALQTGGRLDLVDLASAAYAAGIPFEINHATRIKRKGAQGCSRP